MSNIALILFCLLLGSLLRRIPAFPSETYRGLNAFVIYISLPAITLRYVPQMQFDRSSFLPLGLGILLLLGAYLFFQILHRFFSWDRGTLGCLILVCGMGNISFLGFPVVEAFYGARGLEVAILIDQGTFLSLAGPGVILASLYAGRHPKPKLILKKLLSFPPMLAFIAAMLLWQQSFPPEILQMLEKLGATMTPLSLVSIGLQTEWKLKALDSKAFFGGLLYKLLLAPAFIFFVFEPLANRHPLTYSVSVLEAAMPPMITASIIATEHGLNPKLANSLAGLGILFAIPSLIFYLFLLGASFSG